MSTGFNDEAVLIERALHPTEVERLLATFTERNPHFAGARASDVLIQLYDSDAHLDVIEPLLTKNKDLIGSEKLASLAALAIIYSHVISEDRVCLRCAGVGKRPARPPFAAETPCRRCGGKGHCLQPAAPWPYVQQLLVRVDKLTTYE